MKHYDNITDLVIDGEPFNRIKERVRAEAIYDFAMWLYKDKEWLKELNTFEYWGIDSRDKIKTLIKEYEELKA